MFNRKAKKNAIDSIEVPINEINIILEKANKIYKENYTLLYNFCMQQYGLTKENLHSFRIINNYGNFSLRICNLENMKHYFDDEILKDMRLNDNIKAIKAYNTLNELFLVLAKPFILHYKDSYFRLRILPVRVEGLYKKIYSAQRDTYYNSIIDLDYLNIEERDVILKTAIGENVTIDNYEDYEALKKYIDYYENEIAEDYFFNKEGKLKSSLRGVSLEDYDLKKVNFDGKNISGIDITHNPEAKINFDKIVEDLSDANIEGYNLNKYKFIGWNLLNTNLRGTYASIDLLSCNVNKSAKVSTGTQFDETNTFFLGEKQLTLEEVKEMGIKVYKKENLH